MQIFLGLALFFSGFVLLLISATLFRLSFNIFRSKTSNLQHLIFASASVSDVRYGRFDTLKANTVNKDLEYGLAHDAVTGELLLDEGRYSAHAIDAVHSRV